MAGVTRNEGGNRLKKSGEKYYYDGAQGRIFVENTLFKPYPYRKITHSRECGKVTNITRDGKILEGFGNLNVDSVSSYYWTGDYLCRTPLIIQLNDGYDFYVFEDGDKWKKDDSILYANLRETLER